MTRLQSESFPVPDCLKDILSWGGLLHPLYGLKAGRCSCGQQDCSSPGKHPIFPQWQDHASNDLVTVERWLRQWRAGTNWGWVMGDRFCGLDVDVRDGKEGMAQLHQLEAEHGRLPRGCCASTPTGGGHLIFSIPAGVSLAPATDWRPGIDIRSGISYLAVEPSQTPDGFYRFWRREVPPPMPGWLLRLLPRQQSAPDPVASATGAIPQRARRLIANDLHFRHVWEQTAHKEGDTSPSAWDYWLLAEYLNVHLDASDTELADLLLAYRDGRWEKRRTEATRQAYIARTIDSLRKASSGPGGRLVASQDLPGVLLSDIERQPVRWLWPGRLALGKLTLVDGDPGRGKSVLLMDVAARLTSGSSWPDGAPAPAGGVVVLSAEDDPADTIGPRLDAAGGDSQRVLVLDQVGPDRHPLVIPEDLAYIADACQRVQASLVIVDPLMAYLSGQYSAHKDQDVRRALRPLRDLAEQSQVAVAVVRHLRKSLGPAIYAGGGSIGIVGAARIGLLVGVDPQAPERRVLAATKANLSASPASLAFTLAEAKNGAVSVSWDPEPCALSADAIIYQQAGDSEGRALREAQDFLKLVLAEGPVSAKDVRRQANEAGVSDRTLDRAKSVLKVRAVRWATLDSQPRWVWQLPDD